MGGIDMKCQNSGTELPDGSVFCNKCGAKQVIADIPRPTDIPKQQKPYKEKLVNFRNSISRLVGLICSSKRNIIIASCVGVVVVASIAILILKLNNPTDQFLNSMNSNDSRQAMEIYNDKIKGNTNAENQIKQKLISDAKDIYNEYKNGKIDYSTASDKLNDINNTNLVSSDISTIISNASDLNDSELSYKKGEEYKKSKDYLNAIIQFNSVIRADSNYSQAVKEAKSLSAEYKKNVVSQIEAAANQKDYQQALNLISDALKAFPNDNDLIARQDSYKKLQDAKDAQEQKDKIKKLIDSQQLVVTSAKIEVQSSEYKALYPDMMQVLVKNISNQTVKNYQMSILAFDSNGYPLKIKPQYNVTGEDYEFTGNANDVNILPNHTYGDSVGWNLDEQHGISKIIACVKHVDYYDGSTWDNPYYDYWIQEYKEKQYH